MNEATFLSQRTHTRVKFKPLTVSCQLSCLTYDSPIAQVYDALGSPYQYVPHRPATPTVVMPVIRAIDPDEVFGASSPNEYLSLDTLQWTVNGDPINEVWDAWNGTTGDYEIIQTATDARGTLKIYKNIPPGETATIQFKGQFLDWRTGQLYDVQSNPITLVTEEKGSDLLGCTIDKPEVNYDPLFDDLLLYEYKVARGISVTGNRSDHINGKCYEQTVTAVLTSGDTEIASLPSGITMRLVYHGSNTALVANSTSSPEVLQIAYPYVKLDMRQIEHKQYEVQFLQNGAVIQSAMFTAQTKVTMPFFGKPIFGSDIPAWYKWYHNRALVNLDDRAVEYPELYYLIQWFTQAQVASVVNGATVYSAAAAKTWQIGEKMAAEVADLGIGVTVNDSFFDIWFTVDRHPSIELMKDESNVVLTDESGDYILA